MDETRPRHDSEELTESVVIARSMDQCPECLNVVESHDRSHPESIGCGCLDALEYIHLSHEKVRHLTETERQDIQDEIELDML